MMHIDSNGGLSSKGRNSGNALLAEGQEPKPTRKYWVCVNKNGWVGHWSIAGTKAESVRLFMEGSAFTWEQCRLKMGWRCIKVDIHYLPCR